MTGPASPGGPREEPPFLFGLIGEGLKRSSALVNATFRSTDQRVLVKIWAFGTVAVLLIVVSAGIAAAPDVWGVLQALFAGVFLALLFAVGFGTLVVSARQSSATAVPLESAAAAALNARMAPTVAALDAIRREVIREVKARSITRVPAGIVVAVGLWVLSQANSDPPGVLGFIMFAVVGALGGELWAVHAPDRRYRRVYKERVLPQLAAAVGSSLTYREASGERVSRFAAERILPAHDSLQADDEIAGMHDGLPVEIIEVRLRKRVNRKSRVVFDGLLVGVTLPRDLTGTTVVMTDRGVWDRFKSGWRGEAMEPVRVEHLAFEQRYEVYSTDQIEARALLTPAFMERFMALAESSGFSPPGAMAEGNTLVVALPKRMGTADLFEPPPYWKPAGGDALLRLQADIRKVLDMTEAVIHLDFWASGRQRDASRARQQTEPVSDI